MSRALITQRLQYGPHGVPADMLERNYLDYFSAYFSRITPLGNHAVSQAGPDDYDVLIISGGGELPNRFWNEPKLAEFDDRLAEDRFAIQSRALETAMERRKRVIAICYGMQLVNVFLGGKVTWDIHAGRRDRRPRCHHAVCIPPDNPLAITDQRVMVNHYHNQGVRVGDLPGDLRAFAVDAAGDVVEGALHRTLPLLGLQWHPERKSPDPDFNRNVLHRFLADKDEGHHPGGGPRHPSQKVYA